MILLLILFNTVIYEMKIGKKKKKEEGFLLFA